mmetsp:Transcript_22300/g.41508  ORF Transcript_22300/g.41508 Transcript_22300/m.41508 type:complete len:80 (-) Transcript_22300:71-310(-)
MIVSGLQKIARTAKPGATRNRRVEQRLTLLPHPRPFQAPRAIVQKPLPELDKKGLESATGVRVQAERVGAAARLRAENR